MIVSSSHLHETMTRILKQAREHNEEVAVRPSELITKDKRRALGLGRGSHRRWLPSAMLRGEFGTKHGSKHKHIFTSFSSSA